MCIRDRRVLHEQQELREAVVLASEALAAPGAGRIEDLWEEPGLAIAVIATEVLLVDELGEQEVDLLVAVRLELVERVDAAAADEWVHLDLGRHLRGRERHGGALV